MGDSIGLTLATAGRNGARLATQLIEHSSGLTVRAVTDLDPHPDPDAVNRGECVVAIVAAEVADAPTLYKKFRQAYPTQPLVLVTETDEQEFIETLLTEEHGDYVYHPANDMPFGLISARCKRLVGTNEATP